MTLAPCGRTFAGCPCLPWVMFPSGVIPAGAEQLLLATHVVCPGLAPSDLQPVGGGDHEVLVACRGEAVSAAQLKMPLCMSAPAN